MATLLQCLECGGTVSSQASRCPRCQTPHPFGVQCTVCCKILKRSDALKVVKDFGETSQPSLVRYFHHACYQQVSQVRFGRSRTSCPVCKHSLEFDTCSSITCSNCGHQILTRLENPTFATCCYCDFPLNTRLEVAVKDVQRQFLDGWVTDTLYAHRICYTQERQDEEKKRQKREQIDQVVTKRKQSSFRRNKRSKNYGETLVISLTLGLALGAVVGGVGGGISHFLFGFGYDWKNAAGLGFFGVAVLTGAAVWIYSLFD
jgi:hypothetical protein